jgi:hypothetical protein
MKKSDLEHGRRAHRGNEIVIVKRDVLEDVAQTG